jgi:hypothetical protein
LWSCAATLRIFCSAAPQTNKQNKHKEKICLPGSRMGAALAPAAPLLRAPAPSSLAPSSPAPSSLPLNVSGALAME